MSTDSKDPSKRSLEQHWRDSLVVPAWCPVCGIPMRGGKSTKAYYDWGCCWLCEIEFVEGREDRWRDGWRPSKDEIQAAHDKLYGIQEDK